MLPFILVLLAASSALAAPTVELSLIETNEVAPQKSNGRPVGSWLINNAMEILDGGDLTTNTLSAIANIGDIANSNDPRSQGFALSQAVAILAQLSTGIPGDSCASANFIDSYVNAVRSGNSGAARGAVNNYVQNIVGGLDSIVRLANNPNSVRFATGRRGNCNAGGGVYQFEAAWDLARASASPESEGRIQEAYCTAKRQNSGFSVISRNVGASTTAAALKPIVQIFTRSSGPVANFLKAVSNGSPQAAQAARNAGESLLKAANSISY